MTSRGTVLGTLVALCVGILVGGAVQADPLFNPQVSYSVGADPGWVAVGDLDGDEDLDLSWRTRVRITCPSCWATGEAVFCSSELLGRYGTDLCRCGVVRCRRRPGSCGCQ